MIQRSGTFLRLLVICLIISYCTALVSHIHPNRFLNPSPRLLSPIRNSKSPPVRNSKTPFFSLRASTIVSAPASACQIMNSPATKQVITVASMVFASVTGCLNPVIVGGLLSGALHAISGPDHLAALLPPSVGKPGWYGLKLGATWGLGHGVSAIFLGLCAFFLKGRMSSQFSFFQRLSKYTEAAVGVSLFIIGAIGIKENLDANNESKGEGGDEPAMFQRMNMTTFKSSVSIFLNGILHGFSWDGAPSIAPALAMTSWRAALSFLLSYCLGE